MSPRTGYDAVVVGSGPNGLGAAAAAARAGMSVLVLEAQDGIGGGLRTVESTLPGFRHDHCAAVHPLGAASPLFRALPLEEHGLTWIHPDVAVAHPLDHGPAAVVTRSLDETAKAMGADAGAWRRLVGSVVRRWDAWSEIWLGPPLRVPPHPLALAAFGPKGALPATTLGRLFFSGERPKAALAGFAGHSILPLERPMTGAVGVLFNAATHAVGMPLARGGSQSVADALASYIESQQGELVTAQRVTSLADLPPSRFVYLDLTPRQVLGLAGDRLRPRVRRALERYRYGNGSFKVDFALAGPVPWTDETCRRAGTIHVGGTMSEVALSEREVAAGHHPDRPFVLASQPSICDPSRAPDGKHVLWAYCHVPARSTVDMTENIVRQIERFAPGFRELILAHHATGPADLERTNPNFVGGDIAGGDTGGLQMLFRPRVALNPWKLADGLYLCSQATPPGVGIHGMCGLYAVRSSLRERATPGQVRSPLTI